VWDPVLGAVLDVEQEAEQDMVPGIVQGGVHRRRRDGEDSGCGSNRWHRLSSPVVRLALIGDLQDPT
jgi:hypothetical protein